MSRPWNNNGDRCVVGERYPTKEARHEPRTPAHRTTPHRRTQVPRGHRRTARRAGERDETQQTEETLELLALANFKAAHLTEAERLARQLISSRPTNAYAHTILVRSLERQSRHEEAARAKTLAVALGANF